MRKHRRPAPAVPGSKSTGRGWVLPLILVLAAAGISAWNATAVLGVWTRMPRVQQDRALDAIERDPRATDQFLRAAGSDYEQANSLSLIAERFPLAARDPEQRRVVSQELASRAAGMTQTQLGRVQQALAALLELDGTNTDAAARWIRVRGYLEGLERANFAHLHAARVRTYAALYAGAGAEPAVAAEIGRAAARQPYNAFLQILAARFTAFSESLAASGDATAAQTCRSVLQRLLSQWIIEVGPAGLRLLAADLLARDLIRPETSAPGSDAAAIAADLQAWRTAYRDSAQRRPVALFDLQSEPALAPDEHASLLHWVALTLWIGGAALGAAALTVLAGWAWVGRLGPPLPTGLAVPAVIATVVLLVAIEMITLNRVPELIREDVRRIGVAGAGLPVSPLIATGLTAVLLASAPLLSGLIRPAPAGTVGRWRRAVTRTGQLAILSWVALSLLMLAAVGMTELTRQRYNRSTAAALSDDYRAIAGDQSALLTRLKNWEP